MRYVILLSVLALIGCTQQSKEAKPSSPSPAPVTLPPPPVTQVTPPAPAPTPTSPTHGRSCVNGTDKRQLEVVKRGDGCVLDYTQAGLIKEVISSTRGTKRCDRKQAKLITSLEQTGFKCN